METRTPFHDENFSNSSESWSTAAVIVASFVRTLIVADERKVASVGRRAAVRLDVSLLLALVSLGFLSACHRTPSLAGMWSATIIAGERSMQTPTRVSALTPRFLK